MDAEISAAGPTSKKTNQSLAIEVSTGNDQSVEHTKNQTMRPLVILRIADELFKMGFLERALHLCNDGLHIESRHFMAIFLKGCALQCLKRYAEAGQVLQMAFHLCPGRAEIDYALRQPNGTFAYAPSQRREYDISQYLIEPQQPPDVEDFIGAVEINMTKGRRGRGLFATKDINIGDLLLISNAAVIVNGRQVLTTPKDLSHKIKTSSEENLVAAVSYAAKESLKVRRQLTELDDGSSKIRNSLPSADPSETRVKPELNLQRIRKIVSRNSFSGVMRLADGRLQEGAAIPFCGLWPLVSFINHSCMPNANRAYVGPRMIRVHAAKPIKKREEITVSYFDTLRRQPDREKMCATWMFRCNCKRCSVEKSLSKELKSLNAGQHSATELALVIENLEQILAKTHIIRREEVKNWVRASYVAACWDETPTELFPWSCVDEIRQIIASTVPRDFRTATIVSLNMAALEEKTRDILLRMLGAPCQHLTQALLSRGTGQNTAG